MDQSNGVSEGRLGLALSGGGFRASFFHLGVLARLAELDLLRRVEVISTVSGGSIVGALYYLYVKNLLESTPPGGITTAHYLNLVRRLACDFLRGVEKNIRTLAFADAVVNFRMGGERYSRSDRIGELYDEIFYASALCRTPGSPVFMEDLLIQPKGVSKNPQFQKDGFFRPKLYNATSPPVRVPMLMINATVLNTGHIWRFEATRMGTPAPKSGFDVDVDTRTRLLATRDYFDIIPQQRRFPLGLAVAASAAVPGVFAPLRITGLYQEFEVQLVDGGVADNQGVQSLIDQDCAQIVVSDASGQMAEVRAPGVSGLEVLLRSNSIQGERVREEQMWRMQDAGRTFSFLHLRKGLSPKMEPYLNAQGLPAALPGVLPAPPPPCPGAPAVHPDVQDRLSRIRTDLDSFTEIEACSLMLNGYVLAQGHMANWPLPAGGAVPPQANWPFTPLSDLMARPSPAYLRHLEVGGWNALKYYRLKGGDAWLPLAGIAAGVLGALALAAYTLGRDITLWSLFSAALLAVLDRLISGRFGELAFLSGARNRLYKWAFAAFGSWVLALAAAYHLRRVDPQFLAMGRLCRFDLPDVCPPEADAPCAES